MSIVPAATNENAQARVLRSMVSDPGWFDDDQTKFEDWWRGIRLFLKSNRVTGTYHKLHSACISTTSGLIFTN